MATQVSTVGRNYWHPHLFPVSIALWGERHTHMNSTEAQSEQFGRSAPDLRPAQRDSKIHNRTEPGDWRSGVWQHSETAPERALGGGQDGREARGLAQSGRYRGKHRCSGYIVVRTDDY